MENIAMIRPMKTSMKYDVAIVGAGLVGASLAAALKDSGLSVALIDAGTPQTRCTSSDEWDSRIYAISPGSRRFLEQSGAWLKLDKNRIAPVEEMRIFGDSDSTLRLTAYQAGIGELACILENSALQHALDQALLEQDNLTRYHQARCAELKQTQDGAELTLEDGRTLTANLIAGADGRDSWVRNQAGIGAAPVDYRQHGVVANFCCERPHRNIAYQWFEPDGILALLPLPGNRVSMVWSVSPDHAAILLALTPTELAARVATASGLGELQLITPAAAFALRLLTPPRISAPRIALIGDAAHNMHPLAGQGVNTGFRDARELARLLNSRGGCADCGDAQLLRRYERKRAEDIRTMQATTYGLKNLFCNDDPMLRTLRNLGLNAVNHLSPVKKLLMQHAIN